MQIIDEMYYKFADKRNCRKLYNSQMVKEIDDKCNEFVERLRELENGKFELDDKLNDIIGDYEKIGFYAGVIFAMKLQEEMKGVM